MKIPLKSCHQLVNPGDQVGHFEYYNPNKLNKIRDDFLSSSAKPKQPAAAKLAELQPYFGTISQPSSRSD